MGFFHAQFLWFFLLLPPLLWLALRARRRKRIAAGTLFLWRKALERCPARAPFRWRSPEIICTFLALFFGVLALAGPFFPGAVPAAPESQDNNDNNKETSPAGGNLALCRAEVLGGRLFAVAGNFTDAEWRGRVSWSQVSGEKGASGFLPLVLRPGAVAAVELPVPESAWRQAEGRLELRLLTAEGAPLADARADDDALEARKIVRVYLDAGRFPELARVFTAVGLETAPLAAMRPGNAAAVVARADLPAMNPPPGMPLLLVDGRLPAARAVLPDAETPGISYIPEPTREWAADAGFPLAVLRWLDGLTPAAGGENPREHDLRSGTVPETGTARADFPRGVSARAGAAPWLALLAAGAAAGLAVCAFRRARE